MRWLVRLWRWFFPRPPAKPSPAFAEIVATTLRQHEAEIAEVISDNERLRRYLERKRAERRAG